MLDLLLSKYIYDSLSPVVVLQDTKQQTLYAGVWIRLVSFMARHIYMLYSKNDDAARAVRCC